MCHAWGHAWSCVPRKLGSVQAFELTKLAEQTKQKDWDPGPWNDMEHGKLLAVIGSVLVHAGASISTKGVAAGDRAADFHANTGKSPLQ